MPVDEQLRTSGPPRLRRPHKLQIGVGPHKLQIGATPNINPDMHLHFPCSVVSLRPLPRQEGSTFGAGCRSGQLWVRMFGWLSDAVIAVVCQAIAQPQTQHPCTRPGGIYSLDFQIPADSYFPEMQVVQGSGRCGSQLLGG